MKDILPGAKLIEVRVGLGDECPCLKPSAKYFATLVFKQNNEGKTEVVCDTYAINEDATLKQFPPYPAIGKRLKSCTKTLLEKGFVSRYEFEDGYYLNVWG